ncbi:MAG: T9SS type A sorting domain-containing protein, partial [Candidatus Zixiibacteriota bacterium]
DYIDIGKLPFATTFALAVCDGELYAGGSWNVLKKYVGGTGLAAWEDVGGLMNDNILDLAVDTFNNFLYAGGGFTVVDDSIFTDNVAIWNGFYWEKVGYGNGYQSSCLSVEVYNGDLYAGLAIDSIGGEYTSYLARWDGTNWYNVGGTVKWGVWALEEFQNKLYVGGQIDTIGGQPQKGIACWLDTTPNCRYLKPRVFTENNLDTFYMSGGQAEVQFFNNNAYVQTWDWDFGDTGSGTVKDPVHIYTDTGTYNVCVTVNDTGCVKTACKNIVVDYHVNVAEVPEQEPGFKLYPNPTSNTLYIEITDKLLFGRELQIVDMNGKILFTVIPSRAKESVNIESLTDGVYFVKIGDESQRFVKN